MRNKIKYLIFLFGLLVFIITSTVTVYSKYFKETSTQQFHLQINGTPTAFAVYGEEFDENGNSQGMSLNFYHRADVPEAGDKVSLDATETMVTAYQNVTDVYLGIETAIYATEDVPWYSVNTNIQKVTFIDEISPCSTAWWFSGFIKCTEMNLLNLNTSNVTNMYRMFNQCKVLTVLDVSGFNTTKVESFSYMFAHCNALTKIIGVENLVTVSATSLTSMFHSCSSLSTLDLSEYNTSNVTNMSSMFNSCSKLQTLDISGFDTTSVTNVGSMFTNCQNLTTLTLGTNFGTLDNTLGTQFKKIDLVSSSSKWKDSNENILDWSNIPMGTADTYTVHTLYAYATLSDDGTTLDVYHDYTYPTEGTIYSYPSGTPTGSRAPINAEINWSYDFSARSKITKIIIHNSVSPTSLSRWFLATNLTNASSIEGLDNLNLASVKSTGSTFYLCSELEDDLANMIIAKLANDNAKLTDMRMMFSDCTSLTCLDMCGLDTSSVTHMNSMFSSCTNLKTIIVDDSWSTASISNGSDMFLDCTSLVGGNGTKYSESQIKDYTYACIDGVNNQPGYFTAKIVTYKLILNANDGSESPVTYTLTSTENILTIPKTNEYTPVKDGYVILGWATSPNATEAEYKPGSEFTFTNEVVTLYAVWDEAFELTITSNLLENNTFIAGKTMTWQDWCDSIYNTADFIAISGATGFFTNYISKTIGDTEYVIYETDATMAATNEIMYEQMIEYNCNFKLWTYEAAQQYFTSYWQ